jgi:Arc/MetJ-type ribon-helix-helix transcriptional regulator
VVRAALRLLEERDRREAGRPGGTVEIEERDDAR